MRFFKFFINHMVQKYQNEIAPTFYYRISSKTNEKYLKIPNLQPPDWKHPYWMSLYHTTIHLMGMYIFEVPRMYKERQERGKQTMYRVYSDQGQLWQSGVQIWLDMWRWEDYGGRGTALVSRSGMEWDVMGGLVDTTQLTLPQPPSQPTDRQQQHSRWKLAPAPGLAFVKTHSFFKT